MGIVVVSVGFLIVATKMFESDTLVFIFLRLGDCGGTGRKQADLR